MPNKRKCFDARRPVISIQCAHLIEYWYTISYDSQHRIEPCALSPKVFVPCFQLNRTDIKLIPIYGSCLQAGFGLKNGQLGISIQMVVR